MVQSTISIGALQYKDAPALPYDTRVVQGAPAPYNAPALQYHMADTPHLWRARPNSAKYGR